MNKISLIFIVMCFGISTTYAETERQTKNDEPKNVEIKSVVLKKQKIETTVEAYGNVVSILGASENINFARNIQLKHLFVVPGQRVKAGDPLAEIINDPTVTATYLQVLSAEQVAKNDLARTEELVTQQLATRAQLDAARKALSDAESGLVAQQKMGANHEVEKITAPFAAVVVAINAQPGDRIAAGTSLLQIVKPGSLNVLLGVEPSDAHSVRVGVPAFITSVFGHDIDAEGNVTQVGGIINPQSRLVDVSVKLKNNTETFLTGVPVRGKIVIGAKEAWVVPRSAVLSDEKGHYVYQVHAGKAKRVDVVTENDSGNQIAVDGKLAAQEPIVVQGNYELEEGMAVREVKQ